MTSLSDCFKDEAQKRLTSYPEERCVACPDEYVGTVSVNSSGKVSTNFWIDRDARKKMASTLNKTPKEEENNIVIVLESPHKDEYKTTIPHPAIGTTGNNLSKYFNCLLDLLKNNIQNSTTCHVYLMNAVQYQCSLGFATEDFRSEIFKDIWDNYDGRNSFLDRLKKLNPNIILNLCTNGPYKLQNMVQNAIKSQYTNSVAVFKGSHPSSWNRKSNQSNRYLYINGVKSNF